MRARLLLAAVSAGLLVAGPAVAAVTGVATTTSVPGLKAAPVFAGGGVAWAETRLDGLVTVRMRVGEEPPRDVAQIPALAKDVSPLTGEIPGWPSLQLDGSADTLALTRRVPRLTDERYGVSEILEAQVLAGPVTGPLNAVLRCHGRPASNVRAVAGSGFAATIGDSCNYKTNTITLHPTAAGAPAGAYQDDVRDQLTDLQAAGDWLAWLRYPPGYTGVGTGGVSTEIVVFDARTHHVAYRVPAVAGSGSPFALDDDGTLVMGTDRLTVALLGQQSCRLAWYSPGAPQAHVIDGACPAGEAKIADGKVLYPDRSGPRLIDLTGAGRAFAARLPYAEQFDFDGTRIAAGGASCAADVVLLSDGLGSAPAPLPAPTGSVACPVHLAASGRIAGAVSRVRTWCPSGCRGGLLLYQSKRCKPAYRRLCFRTVGRATVSQSAGHATVTMAVPLWARRLARCSSTLQASAVLRGALLDPYGVTVSVPLRSGLTRASRAACARFRHGAPAFKRGQSPYGPDL